MSDDTDGGKKKKLSGAQSRKRKLEKQLNLKKNTSSIKKFLQPGPSSASEDLGTEETQDVSAEPSPPTTPTIVGVDPDPTECDDVSMEELIGEDAMNDLALWPQVISDKLRICLIDHGPVQINNYAYPTNNKNRSFSNSYYTKKLSNDETVKRDWLVYSKSNDSVYCFYCKLFNVDVTPFNNKTGYNDWQHLSRSIERHEKSAGHLMSVKKCLDLKTDILKGKTVDFMNQAEIEREKKGGRP